MRHLVPEKPEQNRGLCDSSPRARGGVVASALAVRWAGRAASCVENTYPSTMTSQRGREAGSLVGVAQQMSKTSLMLGSVLFRILASR